MHPFFVVFFLCQCTNRVALLRERLCMCVCTSACTCQQLLSSFISSLPFAAFRKTVTQNIWDSMVAHACKRFVHAAAVKTHSHKKTPTVEVGKWREQNESVLAWISLSRSPVTVMDYSRCEWDSWHEQLPLPQSFQEADMCTRCTTHKDGKTRASCVYVSLALLEIESVAPFKIGFRGAALGTYFSLIWCTLLEIKYQELHLGTLFWRDRLWNL